MAGNVKVNSVQLGDSATAANNFVWQTNVDGTAKLARGNVGDTTQNILTVDAAGNVLIPNQSGLGYGTGSGGTVTQATSKSTAVTLNTPTGQITMNNAALASGARINFIFLNSLIAVTDNMVLCVSGGSANPDDYRVRHRIAAGAASITVTNENAGSLSDAIVINFAIIKGAIA